MEGGEKKKKWDNNFCQFEQSKNFEEKFLDIISVGQIQNCQTLYYSIHQQTMNKKKSSKSLSLNHKPFSSSHEKSIKLQLGSLLKTSQQQMKKKAQSAKNSPLHYIGKTTRMTSLNSYQNSELLSKKSSNQKYRGKMDGERKKGFGNEKKRNNILERKKAIQYLVKRQKNKEPRKSSKMMGKNFEFSKLCEENKWQKILKSNFVFSHFEKNYLVSTIQNLSQIDQVIKRIQKQSQTMSKTFLHQPLDLYEKEEHHFFTKNRVLIVDWIYFIGAYISINRQTIHLAVHYLDSFLQSSEEEENLVMAAGASLLLAVKQEQGQKQNYLLSLICCENNWKQKEELFEMERKILLNLNFTLKANTLPFWIDYFSSRWDKFVQTLKIGYNSTIQIQRPNLLYFRIPQTSSYKYYRQLAELSDVSILLADYRKFQLSKLALSCIYLILRVELQNEGRTENKENIWQQSNLFKKYQREFMKRATPIFRDPLHINETFNEFLTQLCEYEMTQIIPSIKFMAQFLDLNFMFQIDEKTFNESQSYEEFTRKMTYSIQIKSYSLNKFQP